MTIINNTFKLIETIGNGNFGKVYVANNIRTHEKVAIKMESENNPNNLIKREASILNYLYRNNVNCIPKLYYYGVTDKSSCIILTLFSCNLLEYVKNNNMTNDDLYILMSNCIKNLQKIHDKNVLHRDIKPQNFMIHNNDIYLIDFGFAYFYKDENGIHDNKETKNIIGSVRYTSYFNHIGEPSSRRDDLLSLGYMFLFLLEDYLIWDTTNITFPQTNYEITSIYHPKNEYIKNKKTLSTLKSFCNNKMISYFNHIYNLKTTSEPNYDYLINLFL